MLAKKPKEKKCKVCKESFTPSRMGQVACNYECAIEVAKSIKEKKDREKKKKNRKELVEYNQSKLSYWKKRVEEWCNRYINLRDYYLPCISCGRRAKNYDAGHYLSVGSNPALRYNELNIHKQCVHCNQYKGSNAVVYRLALIGKIGIDKVEWLEGPHEPAKYTIDDLKLLCDEYKAKCKELKEKIELLGE